MLPYYFDKTMIDSKSGYSGRLSEYLSISEFGTNLPPRKCVPSKCFAHIFGAVNDISAYGLIATLKADGPSSTCQPEN